MSEDPLRRIPVVAGLGYIERVRLLPSSFTATLIPEPDNRYFLQAIAVMVGAERIGYVAPEVARRYFEPLRAHEGPPVACPGRRASAADHETSGVETFLDFSSIPVRAAE